MARKNVGVVTGTLEWSQSQMAFHFSEPGDKKIVGWDPVAEDISSDVSAEFISFLNHNGRERQRLPASEISKMFTSWRLLNVKGGSND